MACTKQALCSAWTIRHVHAHVQFIVTTGSCKHIVKYEGHTQHASVTGDLSYLSLGLDLSNNDLSSLPTSISQLHHLTHLTLSHNTLTDFPPPLPTLTVLEMESNRIYHVTAADLDRFPLLEHLIVSGNPLTEESKMYLTSQDRVHVIWDEQS